MRHSNRRSVKDFLKENALKIAMIATIILLFIACFIYRACADQKDDGSGTAVTAAELKVVEEPDTRASAGYTGDIEYQHTKYPGTTVITDDPRVYIMAQLIWGEARGVQSTTEKAAVAWCVLNRVDDPAFPDTIEGVIIQDHQFEGYDSDNPAEEEFIFLFSDLPGDRKALEAVSVFFPDKKPTNIAEAVSIIIDHYRCGSTDKKKTRKPKKNGKVEIKPRMIYDYEYDAPYIFAAFYGEYWKCVKCGHSWPARIFVRVKTPTCPCCFGRKPVTGYNDLATTHPEISNHWDYEKNGNKTPQTVPHGARYKAYWKCPVCSYPWRERICQITQEGIKHQCKNNK